MTTGDRSSSITRDARSDEARRVPSWAQPEAGGPVWQDPQRPRLPLVLTSRRQPIFAPASARSRSAAPSWHRPACSQTRVARRRCRRQSRFVRSGRGRLGREDARIHEWSGPASPPRRSSAEGVSGPQEALRTGWINAVMPTRDFSTHAPEWDMNITQNPGAALNAAKRSLVAGTRLPVADAYALEKKLFNELSVTSTLLASPDPVWAPFFGLPRTTQSIRGVGRRPRRGSSCRPPVGDGAHRQRAASLRCRGTDDVAYEAARRTRHLERDRAGRWALRVPWRPCRPWVMSVQRRPRRPLGPVGPASAVAPVSPFVPSGPGGPGAPMGPESPFGPAGPAGPCSPFVPAGNLPRPEGARPVGEGRAVVTGCRPR
jgi:hypothetical protein